MIFAAWWQNVGSTLRAEFADLADPVWVTQVVVRLLIAAILGGILGYEREKRGKAAGLRTHMLVALGSALFVLVPQHIGVSVDHLTRVIQGVVAGIGFLGAGSIIKGSSEESIKGLTTAAGIWLTAAIGVAAGLGREATAVLCTLLALLIISLLPRVERLLERREDSRS